MNGIKRQIYQPARAAIHTTFSGKGNCNTILLIIKHNSHFLEDFWSFLPHFLEDFYLFLPHFLEDFLLFEYYPPSFNRPERGEEEEPPDAMG